MPTTGNPGWIADAERIEEVADAARSYAGIRSGHDAVLIPEAWGQNVLAERQALRAYGDKWWRFLSGPFRDARRRLQGLCRKAPPDTARKQLELVDAILEARRLRRRIEESSDLVARLFPGLVLGDRVETHRAFAEAATWLANLHRDVTAGLVGDEVHDMLDRTPDRAELEANADACERATEALAQALRALSDAMKLRADRFEPGDTLEERAYGDLDTWLQSAHDSVPSIHDVVRFNQLEKRAAEAEIPEVAEAAASRPDAARELTGLFEHACYAAWLDSAFRDRPVLAEFDGATHGGIVERFRELDRAQFRRNQIRIAEKHWERLPRYQGGGQLGVLRREFQKKTRHMAVRRLMKEAGRAIQSIKPVLHDEPAVDRQVHSAGLGRLRPGGVRRGQPGPSGRGSGRHHQGQAGHRRGGQQTAPRRPASSTGWATMGKRKRARPLTWRASWACSVRKEPRRGCCAGTTAAVTSR